MKEYRYCQRKFAPEGLKKKKERKFAPEGVTQARETLFKPIKNRSQDYCKRRERLNSTLLKQKKRKVLVHTFIGCPAGGKRGGRDGYIHS